MKHVSLCTFPHLPDDNDFAVRVWIYGDQAPNRRVQHHKQLMPQHQAMRLVAHVLQSGNLSGRVGGHVKLHDVALKLQSKASNICPNLAEKQQHSVAEELMP